MGASGTQTPQGHWAGGEGVTSRPLSDLLSGGLVREGGDSGGRLPGPSAPRRRSDIRLRGSEEQAPGLRGRASEENE